MNTSMKIYLVIHKFCNEDYDGNPMLGEEIITSFSTKETAERFVLKWSNPHSLPKPYDGIYLGELYIKELTLDSVNIDEDPHIGKDLEDYYCRDYEDEEEEEAYESGKSLKGQTLPELEKGQEIKGLVLSLTEGKTKPPAHFNEATLLSAMENPTAYMESHDKAMAKTLGETGGLGTVATRADIIEKLFKSFLLEKRGKDIYLTSKAKQLLELVPEELKQPELTADWEMRLSQIAKGKLSRKDFMKDIDKYTDQVVSEIKAGAGTFRHDNLTNSKCPRCGKRMLAVKGKNSEMLVCQDRECGYRETVSRTTNARCPVCHKKMQLKGRGDGQIFVCVCGHKEKLTSFQERRKKEGAGVSKKDVQKYLRQQKDEPVNNPFADALAKIKL